MANKLTIVNVNRILSQKEQQKIDNEVSYLVKANKENRQKLNQMVFECTASLSEAEQAVQKSENKGWFQRLLGNITGSNKRLQDKVNRELIIAQYRSQITLEQIADQNLMTLDLVAAVNNKLNASIKANNEKFKKRYALISKFFLTNRNDIIHLNLRLKEVEKNIQLLNWQNSVEYLNFEGEEYSELDDVSKLVCLAADFYEITQGKWTTSDLMLLKVAMVQVDVLTDEKFNYFKTVKKIAQNNSLKNKYLNNSTVNSNIDYSYLILLKTLNKFSSINSYDSYISDALKKYLVNSGQDNAQEKLQDQIVAEYIKQSDDVNLNSDINAYDLLLEMIFNLQQGYSENLLVRSNAVDK